MGGMMMVKIVASASSLAGFLCEISILQRPGASEGKTPE